VDVMRAKTVFLLDVDNTLLDNDQVKANLDQILSDEDIPDISHRFWEVYEEVRSELGAVSVPVTLEHLRQESSRPTRIDDLAHRLYSLPFSNFVYPGAIDLLRWLRDVGVPVILSDGDPWFQAKKITDAGLGEAVLGNVLIFLHKDEHTDDIRLWYPAERYFAVDDKPRLLSSLRRDFGDRLTTIWTRQGHYAAEGLGENDIQPDFSISSVTELRPIIERALER
jgi:FMN phosphatase YigB (HAD superfamily)